MVMRIAENNVLEHHTRFHSRGNSDIPVYAFPNLHPVTQYLIIVGNKPLTLIGRIYEPP